MVWDISNAFAGRDTTQSSRRNQISNFLFPPQRLYPTFVFTAGGIPLSILLPSPLISLSLSLFLRVEKKEEKTTENE